MFIWWALRILKNPRGTYAFTIYLLYGIVASINFLVWSHFAYTSEGKRRIFFFCMKWGESFVVGRWSQYDMALCVSRSINRYQHKLDLCATLDKTNETHFYARTVWMFRGRPLLLRSTHCHRADFRFHSGIVWVCVHTELLLFTDFFLFSITMLQKHHKFLISWK